MSEENTLPLPPAGYEWRDGILKQKHDIPMADNFAFAPMTDDELRKLTRERLITLLHDKTIGGAVSLAVCREIADRLDGKPLQRSEGKMDMRLLSLSARLDEAIAREQAVLFGANQPIVHKLK